LLSRWENSALIAFSEAALNPDRNPVLKPHWDASIALIEISFESDAAQWEQKKLFAGFEDESHAEFSIEADRDIMLHDHATGQQFFEWRTQGRIS